MTRDSRKGEAAQEPKTLQKTPPPKIFPVLPQQHTDVQRASPPAPTRYVPGVPDTPDGLPIPDFILPNNRSEVRPPPPPPLQPPSRICRKDGRDDDNSHGGYVPVLPKHLQFMPDISFEAFYRGSVCPVQRSVRIFGRKPKVLKLDTAKHGRFNQPGTLIIPDHLAGATARTAALLKVGSTVERAMPYIGGCTTMKCDGRKCGSSSECSKSITLGAVGTEAEKSTLPTVFNYLEG